MERSRRAARCKETEEEKAKKFADNKCDPDGFEVRILNQKGNLFKLLSYTERNVMLCREAVHYSRKVVFSV